MFWQNECELLCRQIGVLHLLGFGTSYVTLFSISDKLEIKWYKLIAKIVQHISLSFKFIASRFEKWIKSRYQWGKICGRPCLSLSLYKYIDKIDDWSLIVSPIIHFVNMQLIGFPHTKKIIYCPALRERERIDAD